MIELSQACKIAMEYLGSSNGEMGITRILENKDSWIMLIGSAEGIQYGGFDIRVLKESGLVMELTLPSTEVSSLFDSSHEISIPDEYRTVGSSEL